jgi:hypothetical protein
VYLQDLSFEVAPEVNTSQDTKMLAIPQVKFIKSLTSKLDGSNDSKEVNKSASSPYQSIQVKGALQLSPLQATPEVNRKEDKLVGTIRQQVKSIKSLKLTARQPNHYIPRVDKPLLQSKQTNKRVLDNIAHWK